MGNFAHCDSQPERSRRLKFSFNGNSLIKHHKKKLKNLPPEELQAIVTRLAKYKKENKELLSYLLFEVIDEQAFIRSVKEEINEQFLNLNLSSSYLVKKTLRKVLRITSK